ncbi:MAG TPA: chlorite dismutase family protein [Gammaproteobacteria bacterium]|nr:chlorite dismutase family protein [Gammaproteobacteria bacterium]
MHSPTEDSTVSTAAERPAARPSAPPVEPLDLSEKGRREGRVISLDRRLFMKFTAFTGCPDPRAAIERLAVGGVEGVLYLDANDPQGVGLMAVSEDENFFVTGLRDVLNDAPFDGFEHRPEYDMLGRTYSIGYEPDLEDTLLVKPRQKLLSPSNAWAVWYPLQRSKRFQILEPEHQRRILSEHGVLARRYGSAGVAADIRLACHGLDREDNDFIVGLVGARLHPLSAVVQEMRKTEQTAQYLDRLGPFFVGRVAWQSPLRTSASQSAVRP